jgi:hypothetical protein
MKTCNKCKQEKEIELFEITNRGMRSNRCKSCSNIRKAEIRKEKAIASGRKPRRTVYERNKDTLEDKRWCPGCEMLLELKEFVKLHEDTAVYCLECNRKRGKNRSKEIRRLEYQSRRTVVRNSKLKNKFGITPDQYQKLLSKQNNLCAICKRTREEVSKNKKSFAVDHDHKTGNIRGLLCTRCNPGLGFFEDNVQTLLNAIEYPSKESDNGVLENR